MERDLVVELLDTTAVVDTPERIRFRHRVAGPGRRAAAWVIDLVLMVAILWAIATALAIFAEVPGLDNVGQGLFLVALFVVQWGYGAVSETLFAGRTLGKWALGLRVVKDDGGPASFPDFLLRNLLRTADWLPFGFGLGLAVMLLDRRLRRLGDLVAGTLVVVEERSTTIGKVAIDPPVTELERQSLPPRVDLRKDELTAIEAFLQRRRELTAERAEELAAYLGPALSERTGVVAPTWERVLQLAYARATGMDR